MGFDTSYLRRGTFNGSPRPLRLDGRTDKVHLYGERSHVSEQYKINDDGLTISEGYTPSYCIVNLIEENTVLTKTNCNRVRHGYLYYRQP